MPRKRGKWEYREHWIDNNVVGSSNYYVYWYENERTKRAGKQSRKSLKTSSFENAQDKLIQFVLNKATENSDALVVPVLKRYLKDVASKRPSAEAAGRAVALFAEVLEDTERVRDLTEEFQREQILKSWRDSYGHSAGYMSRNMSVLAAAIEHCGIETRPKIHYNKNWIADKLHIPAPVAGRWIPKDDELVRFIDALVSDRAFYWTIIALNTACRPEAALDLGPDQIDVDARLVHLNPEGRPQEPTKYRPDIRLTDNLAGWTEEMSTGIQDTKSPTEREALARNKPWKLRERYVPYRDLDSLQSVFIRTRAKKSVELPKLVPYSLRHKMTTVMRTKQVPEDQVAVLLGHRRPEHRTTRLYGEYDPGYLRDAACAIDEYLWELNKRTDRDLFARSHCNFTANTRVSQLGGRTRRM